MRQLIQSKQTTKTRFKKIKTTKYMQCKSSLPDILTQSSSKNFRVLHTGFNFRYIQLFIYNELLKNGTVNLQKVMLIISRCLSHLIFVIVRNC